jgi:hypothetical protein
VAKAGLKLVILLPPPSKCWDYYRHVPPHPSLLNTFNMGVTFKNSLSNWAGWCKSVIPELGRLRQEDHKFERSHKARLGYIDSSRPALAHSMTLSQNKQINKFSLSSLTMLSSYSCWVSLNWNHIGLLLQ